MREDFSINDLRTVALDYLQMHLPKVYTYHNAEHSRDVCAALDEFIKIAPVADENILPLQIAGIFHDFGYIEKPYDNESLALPYIKKFAVQFGLAESTVNQAHELIMETVFPYHPHSVEGELLCDADIEYIGRADFIEKALRFRQELAGCGQTFSDREWWSMELQFLQDNTFFTPAVRSLREDGRQRNLQLVQQRLLYLASGKNY